LNGAPRASDKTSIRSSGCAQKVKGLAPLACKTDKIDSLVLATLSRRGPGAGDLASRSRDPRGASWPAFALPGEAQDGAQEPRPLDPDLLRPRLPGQRPVRGRGQKALGAPRGTRAVALALERIAVLSDLSWLGAPLSCSPGWCRMRCACSAGASSRRPRPGWRSRQGRVPVVLSRAPEAGPALRRRLLFRRGPMVSTSGPARRPTRQCLLIERGMTTMACVKSGA
jgi:hypothetical protein